MSPILDVARPIYERQAASSGADATAAADDDQSFFEQNKVVIFCTLASRRGQARPSSGLQAE
jgi:hypothetical protein